MSVSVLVSGLVIVAVVAALLRISPRVPQALYDAENPASRELRGDETTMVSPWHRSQFRIPTWSLLVFVVPSAYFAVRFSMYFSELDFLDGSLKARLDNAGGALGLLFCGLAFSILLVPMSTIFVRRIGDINYVHLVRLVACVAIFLLCGHATLDAMAST